MAIGAIPARQDPLRELLVQLQAELEASRHDYLHSAQSLDEWVAAACKSPGDQVYLLPHPAAGSRTVRKPELDTSLRRFADQVVVSVKRPVQPPIEAATAPVVAIGGAVFAPSLPASTAVSMPEAEETAFVFPKSLPKQETLRMKPPAVDPLDDAGTTATGSWGLSSTADETPQDTARSKAPLAQPPATAPTDARMETAQSRGGLSALASPTTTSWLAGFSANDNMPQNRSQLGGGGGGANMRSDPPSLTASLPRVNSAADGLQDDTTRSRGAPRLPSNPAPLPVSLVSREETPRSKEVPIMRSSTIPAVVVPPLQRSSAQEVPKDAACSSGASWPTNPTTLTGPVPLPSRALPLTAANLVLAEVEAMDDMPLQEPQRSQSWQSLPLFTGMPRQESLKEAATSLSSARSPVASPVLPRQTTSKFWDCPSPKEPPQAVATSTVASKEHDEAPKSVSQRINLFEKKLKTSIENTGSSSNLRAGANPSSKSGSVTSIPLGSFRRECSTSTSQQMSRSVSVNPSMPLHSARSAVQNSTRVDSPSPSPALARAKTQPLGWSCGNPPLSAREPLIPKQAPVTKPIDVPKPAGRVLEQARQFEQAKRDQSREQPFRSRPGPAAGSGGSPVTAQFGLTKTLKGMQGFSSSSFIPAALGGETDTAIEPTVTGSSDIAQNSPVRSVGAPAISPMPAADFDVPPTIPSPVDAGRVSGSSGERDDTFPEPPPDEPWMQLRRKALPTKRPEDNYELSDGCCDSDTEEPRDRSKKFVPAWCKNYLEELQRQADVDPDSIFGNRVPQCCLEDIFTDATYKQAGKSRPRRRRGSSGNWSRDPLTFKEVEGYKERIGQQRGWEEACMCNA